MHGEPDERALIDLDQRIHRHVYGCTHNPFLEKTLNEYYVLTLRIWFLALDRVARLEDAIREHRELLVAIRDGDGRARRRRCGSTCSASRTPSAASCDPCPTPVPRKRRSALEQRRTPGIFARRKLIYQEPE